jgi:hypothetical protein
VRRVTQSRTGNHGTCFRASLASILNLREDQVPDFKRANDDPEVDRWLGANYGLRYVEVPISTSVRPVGYHVITGISPRGGEHAVVGRDGEIVWDPHPTWRDGSRAGLDRPQCYGLLLPVSKERTKDMLSRRQLDRYPMALILDILGIDIQEFMRRSPAQRERLLETAYEALERKKR